MSPMVYHWACEIVNPHAPTAIPATQARTYNLAEAVAP